jgi:hypothetical protein
MGNHTIAASYAGDANVAPSTGILMQTVNLAATTTALTVSTNSSLYGQAVTFTATVASPAGTPTGTVTFANDGNALGTVGLTNGQTHRDHLGTAHRRPHDRGQLYRRCDLRREQCQPVLHGQWDHLLDQQYDHNS